MSSRARSAPGMAYICCKTPKSGLSLMTHHHSTAMARAMSSRARSAPGMAYICCMTPKSGLSVMTHSNTAQPGRAP